MGSSLLEQGLFFRFLPDFHKFFLPEVVKFFHRNFKMRQGLDLPQQDCSKEISKNNFLEAVGHYTGPYVFGEKWFDFSRLPSADVIQTPIVEFLTLENIQIHPHQRIQKNPHFF